MRASPNIRRTEGRGFSLVEVLLALGVAAFGLVFAIGMLPVGIAANQDSTGKTLAASIAANVSEQLGVIPLNSSNPYQFRIPSAGGAASTQTLFVSESGSPTGRVGANAAETSRYRVTILFTPPRIGQRTATMARLLVTWPAQADPNAGTPPTHAVGAFELTIALNRN